MGLTAELNNVPERVSEVLSNTFVYGVDWQGNCLARGQLTQRALWQMRKSCRKHSGDRTAKREEALKPACGGVELMMQLAGHENMSHQYSSRVIRAWADYLTYTRQFSFIRNSTFQSGAHLIIFGWYTKTGTMRLRTTVVPFPRMLTADELKEVAAIFMTDESRNHPEVMPVDFCLDKISL